MLAVEFYRAMKQVEELEKKLSDLDYGSPERDELERELKAARAQRDRIKKILDGAKAG
jgi:hypothetical protein